MNLTTLNTNNWLMSSTYIQSECPERSHTCNIVALKQCKHVEKDITFQVIVNLSDHSCLFQHSVHDYLNYQPNMIIYDKIRYALLQAICS